LLDHDVVAVSNINRQLPALLFSVGQSKAELMRARIADINPDCQVTLLRTFLTTENVNELVPADCDYVIDCIDSLACKEALVAESFKRGLKVASSMGAGNRLDPAHIKVADIQQDHHCPLASRCASACVAITTSARASSRCSRMKRRVRRCRRKRWTAAARAR
jgi:tRNA A37 threonylcarbamoyladenosine dehydratase